MNKRLLSALGILLGIVFVSVGLAFLFSPVITMFPEFIPQDLKVIEWRSQVNNPQETAYMEGVFSPPWHNFVGAQYDESSNSWLSTGKVYFVWGYYAESAVMLNHEEPACMWVQNYDGSYVVDLDSCLASDRKVEMPSLPDSSESVTVMIKIQGQSCPNGETVGMTYGYRQIDQSQPMTYSLLGETATHEIDLSTQETMINFDGYTAEGEPYGGYANEIRVLHNATCLP